MRRSGSATMSGGNLPPRANNREPRTPSRRAAEMLGASVLPRTVRQQRPINPRLSVVQYFSPATKWEQDRLENFAQATLIKDSDVLVNDGRDIADYLVTIVDSREIIESAVAGLKRKVINDPSRLRNHYLRVAAVMGAFAQNFKYQPAASPTVLQGITREAGVAHRLATGREDEPDSELLQRMLEPSNAAQYHAVQPGYRFTADGSAAGLSVVANRSIFTFREQLNAEFEAKRLPRIPTEPPRDNFLLQLWKANGVPLPAPPDGAAEDRAASNPHLIEPYVLRFSPFETTQA